MSNVNPNMIGSILQAQVVTTETARKADAQRNKRARDSRELARMAEAQRHEVENAEHVEQDRVHREDEQQREYRRPRDTYEHMTGSDEETVAATEGPDDYLPSADEPASPSPPPASPPVPDAPSSDSDEDEGHVDLSI